MSHRTTARPWIQMLLLTVALTLLAGVGFACKKETPNTTPTRMQRVSYISVKAKPWGELYLDGRSVGRTPVSRYQIAPGKHTVSVKCGPCKVEQEETREVTIEPGQHLTVTDIAFDVNKTSIK